MALRTVGVRLQAEVSGYTARMRSAKAATGDFISELDKAARKRQNLDAVADSATGMGLALTAGFGFAVNAAAKFDKQMSHVSAATHASAADMNLLRDAAIEAGKSTSFSATEAAQGIEELAKAGVSTSAILTGGLDGALDLAAAGTMEVADAAEIAASAMTQFKLDGSKVPHVADLLAAGAGKAQGSVHDLGMALKQAGLVSAQMGLSIEDTTGTLAAMASAGLMGSDAGTSLKTALMMLMNPTDKARSTMEQLGIAAYDTQGQFVGITSLSGQLKTQLQGLTQEQRNAALAQIFGQDAIRAATVLYENGADGIQKWVDKVDDAGYAAETAKMKTDNLIGDVERLTGALESLAIESGGGANGGLRALTQGATALVDEFGNLPPILGSSITVMAGVAGAALLLGAGMVRARRTSREALDELRQMGPVGTRAATGLQRVGRAAGVATTAFIALQVAGAVIGKFQTDLNPQIEALGQGLENWGKGGAVAGEASRLLGKDMEDLGVGLKFLADTDNDRRNFTRWGQDLLEGVVPGLDGTNTSLTKTRERVEAMDAAMAGLVAGGKVDEAKAAFDRLAAQLAPTGVSVEELARLFPQYAGAVEVAGKASGPAAGKIGDVGGAADTAAAEVTALKDAFDALFGERITYDKALIAYRQGIKDVTDELKTGTHTLDTNKQAGRDNASAVLEQIEKIKDLRQARLDHNMSLDEANAKYATDMEGLRATLLQLGYNETAVDELVGKYKTVPGEVSTNVTAPGAKTATKQADDFNFAVRSVPPSKTVPFWATTTEAKAAVEALRLKIKELKDKKIYISGTVHWTSTGDIKVPGGTILKNRWGGAYEHAAVGKLRDAQIASPSGPARYAWAEPQTGGELFAPKYGDLNRTRALVGYAVENWWGGWRNFAPQVASAGPVSAGSQAPPEVRVFIGDRELTDLVRVEVSEQNRNLKRRATAGTR